MFLLDKFKNYELKNNPEILEAKTFLEKIHTNNNFKYIKSYKKGVHTRYYFANEKDKNIIYIDVPIEERRLLEKAYIKRMGVGYEYQDSISIDNQIRHRFRISTSLNPSATYMSDSGEFLRNTGLSVF